MTKLLEAAVARARELPENQQDQLAEALFAHLAGEQRFRLTDEQVEEVKRRQRELREDNARLATEEEMDALWEKCGL
jgi:Putative addiction module component